jgi:hypothetical protein
MMRAHSVLRLSGHGTEVEFALAALATWRLTHLVVEEDGPGDLVVHLRRRAGDGELGALIDCFYCVSIWAAAPFALLISRRRRDLPLAWLALSGAACLLEQATTRPAVAPAKEED